MIRGEKFNSSEVNHFEQMQVFGNHKTGSEDGITSKEGIRSGGVA
jgi:hypothetical protein